MLLTYPPQQGEAGGVRVVESEAVADEGRHPGRVLVRHLQPDMSAKIDDVVQYLACENYNDMDMWFGQQLLL